MSTLGKDARLWAFMACNVSVLLCLCRAYYTRMAGVWAQQNKTAEYLKLVEDARELEGANARYYYHKDTEAKVLALFDEVCLVSQLNVMFDDKETTSTDSPAVGQGLSPENGCRYLLVNDRFTDLNRMFRLMLR